MSFKSRLEDIISNGEILIEHKNKYGKSKYDNNAIERSLMIIGEAMKVLSNKYKIDWDTHKPMIQMGDYLDHQYAGIDTSIVLNTIDYDLPALIELSKKLMSDSAKNKELF